MRVACLFVGCVLSSVVVGCGENKPFTPDAATGPECSDGTDNDGDGTIDFPDDLGCESEADETELGQARPTCDDHRDNDGDGKTDFPDDPGCQLPQGDSEADDCPSGPGCPQCGNGVDDNKNGMTDFPEDPGCQSAADRTEFLEDPVACGPGLTIKGLPATGMDTGTFDGTSTSMLATTCGGGGGASAIAYLIHLYEPKVMVATTDLPGNAVDTVLDLRSASDCDSPAAHIACSDNIGTNPASSITTSLPAGSYYLIVQGKTASVTGSYALTVGLFAGEGTMCATQAECGPGLVCRTPVGASQMICTDPVCSDGLDDDGDGIADHPADPGCLDPADDTEDDDCPDGANCPACADGVDNDQDGTTDYPMDTACTAASANNEACAGELDPILAINAGTTNGTLVGTTDEHDPNCVTTSFADQLYTLEVPALETLVIDTEGSVVNTVLSLMDSTCSSQGTLACDDDGGVGSLDSLITQMNVPAGVYVIAVDADSSALNTFLLNVAGTVVPGESCEGALFQAGALACSAGFACKGPMGSRTCAQAECNDGADNNLDGNTDYPSDPGCLSASDDAEETVCPGPSCPVCADGVDNDGDGVTDYPDDPGCIAASADNETCAGELDPILDITGPTTSGTLVGASDDHDPSCGGNGGTDKIFRLEIPTLQSLVIDTEGSVADTVLSLMTSACSEPALACDDDGGAGVGDSLITRSFIGAGIYTIAVDGDDASDLDTFNLNVSGTVTPFGSCESLLVQAGALTCTAGFACKGPQGSRTCRPAECLDGIDNNADGTTDYPADPGCDAPSDDTEETVCPGPSCPMCGDGLDNDGDGATDYPDDPSCHAGSGTTEFCTQSEPIAIITQQVTSGTTIGQSNEFTPACGTTGTHTAPDVALQLDVPAMQSLNLNLNGFSSAHALLDSTCGGASVACSDPPLMEVPSLAAGTYFVVVDGFSTLDGDWTLETTGVVAPGGSCEGQLFQVGAFTCPSGLACTGPVGMRTCFSGCSDGIDNNSNGTIDYPLDPGCASAADTVEDDVCPGANCPVCSNTMDDDADALIDHPMDFGCGAAGGISEAFCPIETTPGPAISMPQTTGTFSGATDDYEQSCETTTSNDVAYPLQLPVPVHTLVIDTLGSTASNTAVSVWDASCTFALGCDDNSAPGSSQAVLTLKHVPAGNYAVQVDTGTSSSSAFVLNVKGTVAAGTDCTSMLFTSGVLACPTGTTCSGTCQ